MSEQQTTSPFGVRGVVEGFYGPPYTFPERDGLIRFLGRHGFNAYLYAPKNDRQHRARWREPYPPGVMAQFAATVATASAAGVAFCYALSPSPSIRFSDAGEFDLIVAKLDAFRALGVRGFALLFDDVSPELPHAADRAAFPSVAAAHADLANRVHAWLAERDPAATLWVCPTDYHGSAPFSRNLHELGERLHPAIELFYTGPRVCSPTISADDADAFARAARRPSLLWDNYPVNDLAMQPELHLGPIRGRDPALATATRGVLINPMLQAEASKLPLRSWAAYLADPSGYDAERAWEAAIGELAGDESAWALCAFALCARSSWLEGSMAPRLEALVAAVLDARRDARSGNLQPATRNLQAALTELDEACYHIKNRMANLALRAELLPWLELLECQAELGLLALRTLAEPGSERGRLREQRATVARHHKGIGATAALLALADVALTTMHPLFSAKEGS